MCKVRFSQEGSTLHSRERINMKYKMIAVDIDGTLLNDDRQLTERTIKAAKAAQAAGILFVLASGRMPCVMTDFVGKLELKSPMLCYNGALVVDSVTGETITSLPIKAELGREIAAFCEENDLQIQAYTGDSFTTETVNKYAIEYRDALKPSPNMLVIGKKTSEWLDFDTPKMLAIDEPERVAELLPILRKRFEGRVKINTSQPHLVEMVCPEAGKAAALEKLTALLHIERSEVVAFGDGLNDLDMLQWAGTAVAMGNAVPQVKEAADIVAPTNNEDGVAVIIEKILKGEVK